MQRRPIVWAELDERRPAVVLTRRAMSGVLGRVTVAPVTSTVRGIATEVEVDERNGLDHPSVISADNIVTVPASRLQHLIGHLDDAQEARLRSAIEVAHDLW